MEADNGGKKRTIDERIDALTMNLELMSHSVEAMRDSFGTMRDSLGTMRDNVQIVFETVTKLALLADNHQTRIES